MNISVRSPLLLSLLALSIAGCSSRDIPTFPAVPEVRLTVDPLSSAIDAGDSLQLHATVTTTDANRNVTWTASRGTITAAGIYVAPAVIAEDSVTATVTATSVVNTTASATAQITVRAGAIVVTTPNEGSTFTFSGYDLDTNGSRKVGSDRVWTETLAQRNITIGGTDSLLMFVNGKDTTYYRLEANGDLMRVFVNASVMTSRTYPFGSRGKITLFDNDSVDAQGNHHTSSMTLAYVGREIVTIGQKQVLALKVREETKESGTLFGGYTINTIDDYWYAPSLGKLVKDERTNTYKDSQDHFITGYRKALTAYALK
jgi:hypothetical protein